MRYLAIFVALLACAAPVWAADEVCYTREGWAADDDDHTIFIAPVSLTMAKATCHCEGACLAPRAEISFEDNAGNAIDLQGGGNLACPTGGSDSTYTNFDSADTDRNLTVGERIRVNVVGSGPTSHDKLTICVAF